jgi:type I restriction enzyme S subunit
VCFAGGDTVIFSPKKCNSLFLSFLLNTGNSRKELRRLGQGQSVVHIYKKDLEDISISLPSLPEQEKIVEVLTTWDSYIEKLTNTIKLKKATKKSLMQKLLTGKLRLSGFSDKWRKIKLKDVCDIKGEYGINAAAVEYASNLPTYLRITDIDESGHFISNKKKSVNNANYKKFILAEGDIVFARTGATVGKTYLYDSNDGELVFAGFLIRFHPSKNVLLPYFLKSYTDTKPYWNWVKTNSSRSGQPGINGVEYGQLILSIPSLEEQTAIAQILTTVDRDIEALENKKLLIEQQKKFLLNNLINGRIRLPEFAKASKY